MDTQEEFIEGDKVRKPKGYPFPGVVAASFQTGTSGKWRYVVESTSPDTAGMLHIFSGSQLCLDRPLPETHPSHAPKA